MLLLGILFSLSFCLVFFLFFFFFPYEDDRLLHVIGSEMG